MSANGCANVADTQKAVRTSGSLSLSTCLFYRRPSKNSKTSHRVDWIGHKFVVPHRLQPFIAQDSKVYVKVEREGRTWSLEALILPSPLEGVRDVFWAMDGNRFKVYLPRKVYGRVPIAKWHGGYKAGSAGVLIKVYYYQPPHEELLDDREPSWE